MAFSLGTALGGLVQGYQQQQDAQQRQRLIAQQIADQQRQQNALAIAYKALQGGNIFGSPGDGNLPNLPSGNVPPVPGAMEASAPPPPMPGASSQPAAPPPATPQPGGYRLPAGPIATSTPQMPANPSMGSNRKPGGPADAGDAGYAVEQQVERAADAGTKTDNTPPQSSPTAGQTAAAPPPQTAAIATGQAQPTPQHESQISNYLSSYLHTVSPSDLAQAVMQANPSADPATAMMAVQELYKMGIQGSSMERAQTALILGALYKQGMLDLGQQRIGIQQQNADTNTAREQTSATQGAARIAQGDTRLQQGQARIDIANANAAMRQQSISDQEARTAYARASGQQKAQLSELHRQVSDIRGQLNSEMAKPAPDQDSLDELTKRLNAAVARENEAAKPLLSGKPGQ